MSSFVREFMKIDDRTTLDDAIDVLMDLRRALPEGANAELRMRGDDIFGRHLSICYTQPKAVEERATELPYRLAARGMS